MNFLWRDGSGTEPDWQLSEDNPLADSYEHYFHGTEDAFLHKLMQDRTDK